MQLPERRKLVKELEGSNDGGSTGEGRGKLKGN